MYTTLVMWAGFIVLTIVALAFKWWTPGKMQYSKE